jgi:ABC-type dipeptide/oligopeptide/nickel transport system permease component
MVGRLIDVLRQAPTWQRSLGATYVLGVAAAAGAGFAADSTATILLAAAVSLPASMVAVPSYYLAYGLIALVPGANPSEASGSSSCTPAGDCDTTSSGGLAPWFEVTTDVIGVLALSSAALLNLLMLMIATTRRRAAAT